METIQITIDTELLNSVDAMAAEQGISRSEAVQVALERAVHEYRIRQMGERQIAGYIEYPDDDAVIWQDEQVWPD